MSDEDATALRDAMTEKSTAFYATAQVWDDGVILPHETRKVNPRVYLI